MRKVVLREIEELIANVIIPFNYIYRGISIPGKKRRRENDAEHSWALALLAGCLAPHIDSKLDVGKVCELAIAHDLVELYAGDTQMFGDPEHLKTKAEREHQAMKKIKSRFPHFVWLNQTIADYETKSSNEAKFVFAVDKFIAIFYDYLDRGRYFRSNKISLAEYEERLELHRAKAHTHKEIGKYYDELRTLIREHPEYFHL